MTVRKFVRDESSYENIAGDETLISFHVLTRTLKKMMIHVAEPGNSRMNMSPKGITLH